MPRNKIFDVQNSPFSSWHRSQHDGISYVDLDVLGICPACAKILFIADTIYNIDGKYRGKSRWLRSPYQQIASSLEVPYFEIFYTVDENTENRELQQDGRFLTNSICLNATEIAKQTKAKAIITITYSGFNTIKVSSFRPQAFIYTFTNNHNILNTLSLVWGVQGFYYEGASTTSQTIKETKEILKQQKFLRKGDLVVNIASMPAREKGTTNMMKISKI